MIIAVASRIDKRFVAVRGGADFGIEVAPQRGGFATTKGIQDMDSGLMVKGCSLGATGMNDSKTGV